MHQRYKDFLARADSLGEGRRMLVKYAREHGARAAARMSGANASTVWRLCAQKDVGVRRPHTGGPPKLSPEDEARIIDARLAHPGVGPVMLKRDHGLPYGKNKIMRVIREAGLASKERQTHRKPDFRIRICTGRVWIAQQELKVAEYARAAGMTCIFSQVERIRRRVAEAKRKLRWWKGEKVRRERAAKMKGH